MKKNYVDLVHALEEFVRYAMNFRIKIENPYGKKVTHKISGIRIVYLEAESAFQTFSEGIHAEVRKTGVFPQILVTLFYEHYEKKKLVKKTQSSFASFSEFFRNKDGLLRALKQQLPTAIDALFAEFYSSKMEDQNEYIESPTEIVRLDDSEFELPALAAIPEDLREQINALTYSVYNLSYVSDAIAKLTSQRSVWIAVDHSGHRVMSHRDLYSLSVSVSLLNQKKEVLKETFMGAYRSWEELSQGLEDKRSEIQDFLYSKERKQLESGIYPLLFAPSAVGTLFHEAIGAHMLSGAYIASGDSTVFKGKINKSFAKDGFMAALNEIELWDMPLDERMSASYRYDMEGVPAKNTLLIDRGIVRNFLHSRNSSARLGLKNNGHALAQGFISVNNHEHAVVLPEPRVSNLKVIALNPTPLEEIKQQLFDKFGYYFEVESHDGEVCVETGTFELWVDKLVKVFPNGKKEYYHGGRFSANLTDFISAIQMVSDHYGYTQGYCGAVSGSVPTEEYAPAMFIYGVNWASDDLPEKDHITNLDRDKHLLDNPVLLQVF